MDGLTFHKVIRIFRGRYIGATLNRATVFEDRLYFSFYRDKRTEVFVFQSSPPPTLELVTSAVGESAGALSLLTGAAVSDVRCRAYDRLGYIEFQKRRPSGKIAKHTFVLEPMGNYANGFLLNEDGGILYQLSAGNIDPDRDIGVGKIYTEPKPNKRYNLDNIGGAKNFSELTGFYPVTIREAERYQNEIGFVAAAALIKTELENDDLFYAVTDEKGRRHILPFAPVGETCGIPMEQLSFKKNADSSSDPKLKERIRKFYQKQLEHYKKLRIKLQADLDSALAWQSLLEEAELLKPNTHLIKGKGLYKLTSYTENGAEQLDYEYTAELSVTKYVETLYKRSGRLKNALPVIRERTKEVEQMMESAEELLFYVDSAETDELKELAELIKPKQKPQGKKRETDNGFMEFSLGETVIYVGRNSTANHRLVFSFANPNDIWLHAQKIPSAHCIIRKSGAVTIEELQYAANIVARYSKNKNEPKVLVDYTLKKYVKKPKNTPVGFVIYSNFKTITGLTVL